MDTFVEWGPWYAVYIIAVDTSWPHAGAIIRVWVSRTKKTKVDNTANERPTADLLKFGWYSDPDIKQIIRSRD